jgi:hypothetical protein
MFIMGRAEGGTYAFGQLGGGNGSGRLDHASLAVHASGFNGIEPPAFDRQTTGQDIHPLTAVLYLVFMFPNPDASRVTDLPGNVTTNQGQHAFVERFQFLATPFQELDVDVADGTAIYETQHNFLVAAPIIVPPTQQQSVASQRLRAVSRR